MCTCICVCVCVHAYICVCMHACVMFSVCCTHAEALTQSMAVLFSYTETSLTLCLWSLQVQMFVEGETVKILEDEHQVRELQKNHGEWTDVMRQVSSTVTPFQFTLTFSSLQWPCSNG